MTFDLAEALHLLGRFLLGGLFMLGGVKHFFLIPLLTDIIGKRGVPSPRLVLIAGSIFQTVFGAALILGVFVAPAAFGLILFTAVATAMFFNFWDMSGMERENAKNAALTNVALCGGLLITAAGAM